MIDRMLQQLHSPDPQQRRQAIVALANSRDPAALAPLAEYYRSETDPVLRELALKAGRYIRQHSAAPTGESGSADSGTSSDASSAAQQASAPPVQRSISERDRELAKGFLDAATSFHIAGDKARAIDNLGKALSLNPELSKDSFVINLVMMLTGLSVDDGMRILTHPDRRRELVAKAGGKQRLKRDLSDRPGAEKATWDNVLIDFGIYWLVASLSMIAMFVFTLSTIRDLLDSMPTTTTSSGADLDAIYHASLISLIFIGLFYGFSTAISLAIQGGAIHVAATYILGGDGTLAYLYRRLVPFQTVVMLVLAGGFVVLALAGGMVEILFLIGLLSTIGSVVVLYLMAQLVGEVYNFGTGSGCGAIVLGGILLAVLSFLGNYVILSILGRLLGAAT